MLSSELAGGIGRLAVLSVIVLSGCGGPLKAARSRPPPPTLPLPAPSPSPPPSGSVFVIVMENRSYAEALRGPFTAQLAGRYAVAANYRAVTHPSLPNYLALTSGQTWGVRDDTYHPLPAAGLGQELSSAGISWRAYMEGMSRGCFNSPYPYALKHNPFAFYGGACPPEVVPLTRLDADLAGSAPRFAWITPGLCHDGHDCTTAVADQWLRDVAGRIMASAAWRGRGLLLITWDEDDGSADNHVLTLVVSPSATPRQSSEVYDHYSLLATVDDRLGLPRLGLAVRASAFSDLL